MYLSWGIKRKSEKFYINVKFKYEFVPKPGRVFMMNEKFVIDQLESRGIRVLSHYKQDYSPTRGMLQVIVPAAIIVEIHKDDIYQLARYNEVVEGYSYQRNTGL